MNIKVQYKQTNIDYKISQKREQINQGSSDAEAKIDFRYILLPVLAGEEDPKQMNRYLYPGVDGSINSEWAIGLSRLMRGSRLSRE